MGGRPGTFWYPCKIKGPPESVVLKTSVLGNLCSPQVFAVLCVTISAERQNPIGLSVFCTEIGCPSYITGLLDVLYYITGFSVFLGFPWLHIYFADIVSLISFRPPEGLNFSNFLIYIPTIPQIQILGPRLLVFGAIIVDFFVIPYMQYKRRKIFHLL